jgi:hypothetical protein
MTIQTLAAEAVSGDNTTTHVVTAGALAAALSELTDYLISLAHLPPFPDVATMVFMTILASLIMQKLPVGK